MNPVMLYYAPHHSHERMANSVDAELIKATRVGPLGRIREARRTDVGDRPVITEGGQPLFQAAWMKKFGNCGPIIHLAADETLMNIFNSLPHYSKLDRMAHFWAHRHVDAVMAVSPRLTAEARALGTSCVKTIFPFAEDWKHEALEGNEPDFESNRILAVGSYKPANNFGSLEDIAREADVDVQFDVFGPDTDELGSKHVTGHGFVEKEKFIDYFSKSQAFILPAISQAFPVSVLESLRAGLPPLITDAVGTQPFVRKISPHLVTGAGVEQVASSVTWYTNLSTERKREISQSTRNMSEFFKPSEGVETFKVVYNQILDELGVDE